MTAPPPLLRVAVAASGGRDSTALLHCTVRAAARLGVQVLALHVHHGLLPAADAWLAQVRSQSRRWGAQFDCRRLSGQPGPGDSIEAWARAERYRALTEMAQAAGCGLVLLAHHRRDQAETFLLQALRGGGPAGLSAMPRSAQRHGITWARPWLEVARTQIELYVQRHRLRHADDTSNADVRFARSRLRMLVWPPLLQAFPDAETALAGAARRAQQAAALAAEVAAMDLPPLMRGRALDVAAWLALPPARRSNALAQWLTSELHGSVPGSLLQRLLLELPACVFAHWQAPGAVLRLYRGMLRLQTEPVLLDVPAPKPVTLDLRRTGTHPLPAWGGALAVTPSVAGGVPAALLGAVQARARAGGERFCLAPQASARSLKKQFQTLAIEPGLRTGPLLFAATGGMLFVPGLGIDARCRALPGAPRLHIDWLPDRVTPGRGSPAG